MELCHSYAEAEIPLSQSSNSQSMKADSAYLLNDRVMNVISIVNRSSNVKVA